ncbi:AzlC family ABC transporter permease [Simiduia curdlanivorans]|uniref:AzlC family ABC transporter permease n=1 Tax=Simiduia curdlanivorans TaxID=1492769 RepID=A0ABV8V3K1_9GAMM|nr:AzlC family ABC transporter permease [Simiduia curdlanivorans]MDN3638188.1 AzlC family ABC transporter permease [Simiduia curdlanivorans]
MFNRNIFFKGALHGSPFLLVIAPFGLLFGVVAAEAGLTIIETLAMTILVIAGASQFTALALLSEHAPTLIIIIASLAVNLRMAMYSAALVPHFGEAPMRWRALAAYFMIDQTFAVAVKQYDATPAWSSAEKLSYYFGSAAIVCPFWYCSTYLGAVIGEAIPKSYSLDFAIPICFIAIIAPMIRNLPHLVTLLVSVTVALCLSWLPYNIWLLISALLAMMAGAQTEYWLERRKP